MKRFLKICLALILVATCLCQSTVSVFAAKKSTEYVSEVILSYGNTAEEAKKWLTDNGYQYVDSNLNDGADDPIFLSKARAVYLGYKTTTDPDKAITDMKLMNMNGGYSVQDYKMILEEKKSDIQQFINQFIAVLSEYRANYKAGSPRAEAAYKMLNMMKEDDTGLLMGDLLLTKIKEEYSDKEFAALSAEEQKQHADMTTVLMQGNSEMVLYIEQILSTATDTNDTLWLDRFAEADDYDTMLEDVMDEENVDPAKAEKILSSRYDEDAKVIGSMVAGYREWLSDYTDAEVKFTDSGTDITAYVSKLSDGEKSLWFAEGSQYELLNNISYYDETTLLDLFLDEDLDLAGEDAYMLYPVVSVLSDGQRAGLEFINGSQLFAMGLNTDEVTLDANIAEIAAAEEGTVSVYSGVDRSIYSDEVALTGDAYKLQNSGNKDYSTNWFDDGLSDTTKVLGIISASVVAVTIGAFVTGAVFAAKVSSLKGTLKLTMNEFAQKASNGGMYDKLAKFYETKINSISRLAEGPNFWSKVFTYTGIGLSVVAIILSAYTLWCAYDDLKAYYKADFTPIPLWMVDQGVDENDAKTFTYYKVVNCNRVEGKFTADNTKLLKNFGDINGDVGKQWLALYTTTDKAAGDPIVADFTVQIGKSDIPGNFTALSLFGSESAQNLTDTKAGFTYNDEKGGIYLFYNTDATIFAGSAITTGTWAVIAGGVIIIGAVAFIFIKRKKEKGTAEA